MTAVARFDGSEVVLAGRLDVHTVADVRSALHTAIDAGEGRLVVNLYAAEVMDATGLGVLIGGHRRAERAGRALVLRGPGIAAEFKGIVEQVTGRVVKTFMSETDLESDISIEFFLLGEGRTDMRSFEEEPEA